MQQLPLGISQPAQPAFDNFVAGPNAEALTRVRELAAGALGERIVYLWGASGSGRSHLLRAAGRANPALLALRADLRTRLAWGLVYQLLPIGDEDKARHLKTLAAERGLQLSDDIVGYLLTRLPRDMTSLRAVLEVLDRYSLMRKKALTLSLVREALGQEILGGQP